MHDQESKITSRYNEAGNQIRRLDEIWTSCRTSRESGRLLQYKEHLTSAENELYTDAEKVKYIKKLETINIKILSILNNKGYSSSMMRSLLNFELINKERLLRKIQDESGKGGSYKELDADEDLD